MFIRVSLSRTSTQHKGDVFHEHTSGYVFRSKFLELRVSSPEGDISSPISSTALGALGCFKLLPNHISYLDYGGGGGGICNSPRF